MNLTSRPRKPLAKCACRATLCIALLAWGNLAVAQTDNPPPAATPEAVQTNNSATAPIPAVPETNNPAEAPAIASPPALFVPEPPATNSLSTVSETNNTPAATGPAISESPAGVTTPPVAAPLSTNTPPAAAVVPAPVTSENSNNVTRLPEVTVYGKLDKARSQIMPDLGATAYSVTKEQLESESQGDNAPFNEVILRAPGVAQDSAVNGDLHVRGEHANLQYRINDVLLPEGITGFGLELDPRFVESLQLITGSLPAQYGFRTAGVVDIQTKSGAFENGGEAEMYGGSYDTLRPSVELGGSEGKLSYFFDGSCDHNDIGIENPTGSSIPIHDTTDQGKAFTYLSYILDDTSRVTVMGSASYSDFQVPNTPGVPAGTSPNGNPWVPGTFDSANLNENQNEQNYYGVVTYQKSAGDLNFQTSVFARNSTVHFIPDPVGDLFFNGVASDVDRKLYSGGLQTDGSYVLNDQHTLRAGVMLLDETVSDNSTTTVFPVDSSGNPTGPAFPIGDNQELHGLFYGAYLQDEWKIVPKLTLNYGARFDVFSSSFDDENQLSPRANLIYEATKTTTLHAGYSRYFTPPPVENVSGSTITKFAGTSNASQTTQDSPVKAERSNYFDAGVSQKLAPGLQAGIDGYYKQAENQLDDGLFGQTLILSAFNYREGRVYGVEFTTSYITNGFSSYANVALSKAQGKDWSSAQFLFDPADLAYVKNHWIYLDHDQLVSGSFGASYTWNENHNRCTTRLSADVLYGSGLRTDATVGGQTIPNGGTVPQYYSINVGAEQSFQIARKRVFKARLDVVNLTDNVYELRNGTGVGVNAAQYGERRGLFGSLAYEF
jgi:outer membrane receptor protein involved in Fe transport